MDDLKQHRIHDERIARARRIPVRPNGIDGFQIVQVQHAPECLPRFDRKF